MQWHGSRLAERLPASAAFGPPGSAQSDAPRDAAPLNALAPEPGESRAPAGRRVRGTVRVPKRASTLPGAAAFLVGRGRANGASPGAPFRFLTMNRMPHEPDLSLRRSKRVGLRICIAAAAVAALFLWGIAVESYWALAIPVAVAVLTALTLMFWIGYTINTVRGIPAEAEHYRSDAARWIALGICGASVLLALVFLLGIVARSYWALAIPVGLAVLSLAGMVFWIGWAIVTQKPPAPGADAGP